MIETIVNNYYIVCCEAIRLAILATAWLLVHDGPALFLCNQQVAIAYLLRVPSGICLRLYSDQLIFGFRFSIFDWLKLFSAEIQLSSLMLGFFSHLGL